MAWQIDLVGETLDIRTISDLAKAALRDCVIIDGPDERMWIGGPVVADSHTPEEARERAAEVLDTLNGLARFQHPNHWPVRVGGVALFVRAEDGTLHRNVFLKPAICRARASLAMTVIRANGDQEVIDASDSSVDSYSQRIANDPKLRAIVVPLGESLTWQRLRIALERLTALIGRSARDTHALWQQGYAEREEIERLEANIEDPRHSGDEAVHGVPRGKFKGEKITVDEGFALIVRILRSYLDRN